MNDEPPIDPTVLADISALIASEEAAWEAGSAEDFAARVLPDVVFTNIVGMFSVGKAPFVAQHERIFATIYRDTIMRQTVQHITQVTPDVVIVDTLTVGTGMTQLPPGVEVIDGTLQTRLEQVLVRRDDGWWVASFHNVAVNPAAGGPPPPLD